MTLSKSPERGSFMVNSHIKSCKEKGTEPTQAYLDMLAATWADRELQENDPNWQTNNLEYDLRSTQWILDKVRTSKQYAQNLYAALCNNDFRRLDVVPILTDQRWSCSWRSAGGIVANMRQTGDYIEWYCSGIRNFMTDEADPNFNGGGYASEGVVTEEVRNDLYKLGWVVLPE